MGDAGGDPDWYGYCLDDPVNGVDPLGLFAFTTAAVAGMGLAANYGPAAARVARTYGPVVARAGKAFTSFARDSAAAAYNKAMEAMPAATKAIEAGMTGHPDGWNEAFNNYTDSTSNAKKTAEQMRAADEAERQADERARALADKQAKTLAAANDNTKRNEEDNKDNSSKPDMSSFNAISKSYSEGKATRSRPGW